jgi:hypothetical protein
MEAAMSAVEKQMGVCGDSDGTLEDRVQCVMVFGWHQSVLNLNHAVQGNTVVDGSLREFEIILPSEVIDSYERDARIDQATAERLFVSAVHQELLRRVGGGLPLTLG